MTDDAENKDTADGQDRFDIPVLPDTHNSPEQVAYKLLYTISKAENKRAVANANGPPNIDRQWLLDTYAECLLAVRDPNSHLRGLHPKAKKK